MISYEGNFIFFHNPKAAGSSVIRKILEESKYSCILNKNNQALVDYLSKQNILWPNHAHPKMIRDFLRPEVYQQYFKFSFVRDPRSRLLSTYFYTKQKEQKLYEKQSISLPKFNRDILESENFEDWIINFNNLPEPQISFFTDNGEMLVDFIGKTELLSSELNKIKSILQINDTEVESLNTSQHKSCDAYFTEKMNQIVREKYADDFLFFGYKI